MGDLFGGSSVQAPQQSLLNTLMQAYQGQANTAGPYFNLNSVFGPGYGQTGLAEQQQQMFGYNVGPNGGIGTPATPPGGFFGGGTPTSAPVVGPQPGGTPTGSTSPYTPIGWSGGTGGAPGTPSAPAAPSSAPSTGGTGIYSPPQGTRIGNGIEFNDPYAGTIGPGQTPGYHPGVLDLNTTALSSFGPLATGSLLQSNPYLFDALNLQNQNAFGASDLAQGPAIQLLQQQALQGLQSGGQLSPQEQRDLTQQTLAGFAGAGNAHGNSALATDLLSRDSAVRSRMQQAQALASGVQSLQSSLYGNAGNLSTQAAGSATSGITNPILQILGLGSLNATSDPNAAISGQSQLTNPFLQAGTDIASNNFNAQSAASIANANNSAATNAGYLQLIGAGLSAYSDERLKKKIKKAGKSPSGVQEVEWEYATGDNGRRFHGTTAQLLEKSNPYAVSTDPVSGIKVVDYSKTDVPFYELSNPYAKAA